ncbi:MAG: hypothetical protein Q7J84_10725 [Sulfuricaulis sp.]|nr:hypothetical protein [Sulfuricaulis sp.]
MSLRKRVYRAALAGVALFASGAIMNALASNEYASVRGKLKVCTLDGNSNAPTFIGVTKKVAGFDFPILTTVTRIEGDTVMPSSSEVMSLRAAATASK